MGGGLLVTGVSSDEIRLRRRRILGTTRGPRPTPRALPSSPDAVVQGRLEFSPSLGLSGPCIPWPVPPKTGAVMTKPMVDATQQVPMAHDSAWRPMQARPQTVRSGHRPPWWAYVYLPPAPVATSVAAAETS
jgi:hypothetical protein